MAPCDQSQEIEKLRSDFANIERAFQDACDEAGCAYDNEQLLFAIARLKAERDSAKVDERVACAKLIEENAISYGDEPQLRPRLDGDRQGIEYAKAIRERGDTINPMTAAAPEMFEAIERQVANIERWLATGEAAGPDESKSIYDQLCKALAKARGPFHQRVDAQTPGVTT